MTALRQKRPVGLTSMSHVGHNSDVSPWSLYVRCWGQSGKHVLAASISEFDPMYGRAVRCKKISSNWRRRSCINVSGLRLERVVLRAIMDISAHAF
jgi:hypothetical protein